MNLNKKEVILVDRRPDLGLKISPILYGTAFPLKEWICSLGVLLNTSLLMNKQVAVVSNSAFYQL